ncbi:N-carbamoyl-L-amino-acid hydrolase [Paramyrothecium foliicola]|nr:N-carbamoyl-L-amino-acid hydrolase [Paramyrothecium foliicola]
MDSISSLQPPASNGRPRSSGAVTEVSSHLSPTLAHQAFEAAAQRFSSRLNPNVDKTQLLSQVSSAQDIHRLLEDSKSRYDNEKKFLKARKWLTRAALTIHHYGTVIDVFAQVSPIYVSLVWGSMKLVVSAAQNHQDTISLLAKALSQIGDALANVELATNLFPTERMRRAVEELYTHIFEFFERAQKWYQEGWCRHLWHSFSQPPKLQWKDIVEDILESSNRITQLSHAGSQGDIREIKLELMDTKLKLMDIMAAQALHSSALINTDKRLIDLQFSSISSFLAETNTGNAMSCYQHIKTLVRESKPGSDQPLTNNFWLSPKLSQWSSATTSKLTLLQGKPKVQTIMQEVYINLIEQLRNKAVPIIWALPTSQVQSGTGLSTVDLLKHLVLQVMQLQKKAPYESEMTRLCTQFKTSTTEREWIRLLIEALTGIGPQCYIVVDLSAVNQRLQPVERGFTWMHCFEALFAGLSASAHGPKVKVCLVSSDVGNPTDTGMSRLTLSDDDKKARDWFVKTTEALGCKTTVDAIGNIFAVRPGRRSGPPTFAGSHLDTQPTGGRYDGILGVMAGIEMLKVLQENNVETEYPVGVVNWTNEEGARFPMSMMASGVWAEKIPLERAYALKDVAGDANVKSELERIGYLGDIPASYKSTPMAAHFELHIEQGPILERAQKKIGVVQGVQAYKWFTIDIKGRDAHTGSTPFADRADALLLAARLITHSHRLATKHKALASTGILNLKPGSTNTIPGHVRFTLDIRAPADDTVANLEKDLRHDFELLSQGTDVGNLLEGSTPHLPLSLDWSTDTVSPATKFHPDCIQAVRDSAESILGGPAETVDISSGAGHDSVYTNHHCPTTMIFIPCKNGVSHNPEEYSTPEECAVGAEVLCQAVVRFDQKRA